MEPKEAEEEKKINFVLMVRKGNKPQYKTLEVPMDSDLALNLKNREEVKLNCLKSHNQFNKNNFRLREQKKRRSRS
jgi:hypothetical protein